MMAPGGGWMMLFGGVFWLFLVALIVIGIMRLGPMCQHGRYHHLGAGRRSSGLDILEERYAKGEIQREEYLEKKRDLTS
jgi:putative membrane protein